MQRDAQYIRNSSKIYWFLLTLIITISFESNDNLIKLITTYIYQTTLTPPSVDPRRDVSEYANVSDKRC